MRKTVLIVLSIALGISCSIYAWNFMALQKRLNESLGSDPRNGGISALAHYQYWINSGVLVFDLREVSSGNSAADVSRALLQFSAALKEEEFDMVVLSFEGERRFMLEGEFFNKLGREYGVQNPVYTLRTLPENVLRLDGTPAFQTWAGGILGVTGKQMDDLNEFHRQWWLNAAMKDS